MARNIPADLVNKAQALGISIKQPSAFKPKKFVEVEAKEGRDRKLDRRGGELSGISTGSAQQQFTNEHSGLRERVVGLDPDILERRLGNPTDEDDDLAVANTFGPNDWGIAPAKFRRAHREGDPHIYKVRAIWGGDGTEPYEDVLDGMLLVEEPIVEEPEESAVEQALQSIKPQYAQILRMYFYENYTLSELAKELDITDGNARVRFSRAKEAFRAAYASDASVTLANDSGLPVTG